MGCGTYYHNTTPCVYNSEIHFLFGNSNQVEFDLSSFLSTQVKETLLEINAFEHFICFKKKKKGF